MAGNRRFADRAFLLLALALLLTGRAAAEEAGVVHVIIGSATLIDAKGREVKVLRGTSISEGDRIITADQSLLQLKLRDGSYLSVRMNTDVTLAQFRYHDKGSEDSGLLLQLAKGALRSITGLIAKRNPLAYSVRTPTATIGVRGTDHEPVFIPEPKPGEVPLGPPGTYDKVNSGATFIRTPVGTIDVQPGQVGFVSVAPRVAPVILPKVPEFFGKLEARDERGMGGDREGRRPAGQSPGEKRQEGRGGDADRRPGGAQQGTAQGGDPARPATAADQAPAGRPALQPGQNQFVPNRLGSTETTPPQATPTQIAPTQVAPTQVAPTQIAPTQIAPTQIAPTQVAPTQVAPTQIAPTQIAPTQITPTRIAPTQITPTQTPTVPLSPINTAPTTILR
jgi:hypothetical protein